MRKLVLHFLAGALFLFPVAAAAQTIKIGVATPLTGRDHVTPYFPLGEQLKAGVELAVADLNARGGVLGQRIEVLVEDDRCEYAKDAAERLVSAKVSVAIGHVCRTSEDVSSVYTAGNVLQIAPATTFLGAKEKAPWNVFRVGGRDEQQGPIAARYIAKNFSGQRIAFLHDRTSASAERFVGSTRRALHALGVKERFSETYDSRNAVIFDRVIARLKRENIGLVYVSTGGADWSTTNLLKDMREAGLKTVLMSGDELSDPNFRRGSWAAKEGALFTYNPDARKNPEARGVVDALKRGGREAGELTLYAYAAVQVWAQAATAAKSIEPRSVAAVLKDGTFSTVLGTLSFDSMGDRKFPEHIVYRFDDKASYSEAPGNAVPPVIAAPPIAAASPPAPPAPIAAVAPKPAPPPPAVVAPPPPPPVVQTPPPAPPPAVANVPPQPQKQVAPAPPPPAVVAPPPPPPVVQAPVPVDQGRRVALVIGNSAYKNVSALTNPQRDASTIATALRQVGFQSVTVLTDLDRNRLTAALQKFAETAENADWSVVYFAGHGMEIGGINYLIPIDAKLASDRDIAFQAVSLEVVLNAAERAKKLRLVILDACRDNPFAAQMKRTMAVATRSVTRGLAQVEPEAGTMVVYAAKHGETALDGSGNNSPFATSLAKNLLTPGLEVRRLFDTVRDDVMDITGRKQQPFSYGSISARQDFYFTAAR